MFHASEVVDYVKAYATINGLVFKVLQAVFPADYLAHLDGILISDIS